MRVSQGNLRTTQVACATPPVVEEDAVIEGQPIDDGRGEFLFVRHG